MLDSKKPLVVVLSRNYSTGLSVIRSLGCEGYTVDLVASAASEGNSGSVASSKYIRKHIEIISKKVKEGGDPQMIEVLLSYADENKEKIVLLPTDDYTTSMMDLNRDKLSDIFIMPEIVGGKQGTLKHYMNKAVQGEIARRVGILTPQEWTVSLENDEIEIPEDMVYPCYCKPLESSLGYKQEMAKCEDRQELLEHLYTLQKNFRERSILVQEFMNIDEEIDLEGICIDQKIILPGIVWKRVVAQYDRGVPLEGKTFPMEELGAFNEKIVKFLQEFHYFGMFDLGFNIVGDKIYFNELNVRSGGTNYVYFKSGVNLPNIFVKEALGEGHAEDEEKIKEFGKSYLYEKVAWDDYFHNHLSKEEVSGWMESADITFILDEEDPIPGKIFMEDINSRIDKKVKKEKRAAHVDSVAEAAGWDREYALEKIKDARERFGISYNDYDKYEFWKIAEEEQEEEYNRIIVKREKRKHDKEECIMSAMSAAEWDREYAETQIKDARERLGISYNDYRRYNFCLIPVKKQEKEYEKIKQQKAAKKAAKEAAARAETAKQGTPIKLEKPLVVVLSRSYSTGLSVIRSLGAAGFTVDLIANAHKAGFTEVAGASRYVRNYVEVVSKKVKSGRDLELLEELFKYEGKYEQKPVLFPTDDYTASVMDENRDDLEKIFIMPGVTDGKQGDMTALMDKRAQSRLAKESGLRVPLEWIFDLEEELVIPDDMVYPCFVKPIESISGYKREMAVCNSEDELKFHLDKLRRIFSKRAILVQEYLEIDNEIDLSGVALDQKVIIPAIIKKTNVAQYEKGVTLAGKVYPYEELEDISEAIETLIKKFRYTGMFDLEFNIVGDKIYFNEVNLRSGGPNFAYFMSGVNLPALYVNEALSLGHTEEDEKVGCYGKSFIYEKVAWEDHINGFMTKRELNEWIDNADIKLVYSTDDPEPAKVFIKKIKEQKRRKQLRGLKKSFKTAIQPFTNKIKSVLLRYPQSNPLNKRDPNSENARVIVTGRNYCSNLTIARSVGEAGYEVEVLRIFQKRPRRRNLMKKIRPDAYSKYVKAYHVCVSNRKSRVVVDRLISLADENRKMLIIPADDLMANIIDDYYEELSEFFLMPNVNNKQGEVNRLMSKEVQKELAQAAGLPVLNSCVIKTEKGDFEIPDSITYPCFMKPNISKNSSKGRMRKCESEAELRGYITEFSMKKDIEMLVEDFVDIGREYSLLGLCAGDSIVSPGFFGAEKGGHEARRGVAMTGRMLPCEEHKELIDSLNAFMKTLGFTGLYDIDLIETTDGKMYFVEVNMRYGASGYAVTKCGANLPGLFADHMYLGKSIDESNSEMESDKTFISEKVMMDEYAENFISRKELDQLMDETDIHFVKNDEDTRPYRHFKRYYKIAAVMRKLYAIRERRNEAGDDN